MRKRGYIRWYCQNGDDGLLKDFEGREWYFSAWSFPRTHYVVTGICKKTKRKKTIKTNHFPGLCLDYEVVRDPQTRKLEFGMPVSFEAVADMRYPWAVKIKMDLSEKAVLKVKKHQEDLRYEYFEKLLEQAIEEPENIGVHCRLHWLLEGLMK